MTNSSPGESGVRGFFRRIRIDISPLRESRDFRLLFMGGSVSFLGSMVTYVALPFQVKELTGSYLAVGLLGLVELFPLIAFGLYGGALADALDRRRLVLVTEATLAVMSALLLVNALLPQPQLWPIYVFAVAVAALDGLQRPSLEALVPRIVAYDKQAAAAALSSLRGTIGMILGPAIGGILVATAGVWSAYLVDVLSFGASLIALALMRAVPPALEAEPPSLRRILDGLGYAWSRKDLLGTYLVDLSAMFFAFPYALFPFVADALHAPWSLGLLYSAGYVGSMLATLTSGWTSHVHHHGRAIVWAAAAWGAAIAAFGLSTNVWWALGFLVVAGGADMTSGLFRMLMWNQTIPDAMRGRMAGIEMLSYSIGPQLGQVRSSVMARMFSLRTSIFAGGVSCVLATGLLAFVLPALWTYDSRTDVNAVRERGIREERARSASDDT
jgi:MFS family permease